VRNRGPGDFWLTAHAAALKNRTPLRVMFELTYTCNFNCPHCYVPPSWRRKKDLSTTQVFDVIRSLAACGCFYLGLTGGEIFLRRDIWKILEFVRRQGMQTILYTNGSLIDKSAAERLSDIGVNKVDITLPGRSRKVFEGITGVRGSHGKVFRAIGHLHKHGVPLGFKTCLLKANQPEIGSILDFCAKLGSPHRLDDGPSVRIDGDRAPLGFAVRDNGADFLKSGHFQCASGISQCAITPQGRLKLCPLVPWPSVDVTRGKFRRVWEELPRLMAGHPYRSRERLTYACPGCAIRRVS
jgi:MoaA/NifB/PqqE/SkfB family radical SAM enzyme